MYVWAAKCGDEPAFKFADERFLALAELIRSSSKTRTNLGSQ
jgi:hypothetical protein